MISNGFSACDFALLQKNGDDIIYYLHDKNYYFQFRAISIAGQLYRDIFYYFDSNNIEKRHYYFGCDSFIEALKHFSDWVASLKNL